MSLPFFSLPRRHAWVACLWLVLPLSAAGCGDASGDAPSSSGASSSEASSSSGTSGAGGGGGSGDGGADAFDWGLPPGVPPPKVPADNPMSTVKVELGRHLFFDKRLSGNETLSCGGCHSQAIAFTDGAGSSVGSTGESTPRSSMSLTNVAYLSVLTWGNPLIGSLEEQALLPLFGEVPVELGMAGLDAEMLDRLAADPLYVELFPKAFPEAVDPITLDAVLKAIAAFERSMLSFGSPYDRYSYFGDPSGMSDAALRGKDLFFSEQVECFHCHGGFNLSDSVAHEGTAITEVMFHNTGLYNIDGLGGYPAPNTGVHEVTGLATDMGRFRAPTLRNIAVTAPYMHDGSVATLDEVLDHYAAGGRTIASGPYAGDGSKNPYKSELINGFDLSPQERTDLIAFLQSLTDEAFLVDPRFSSPFPE